MTLSDDHFESLKLAVDRLAGHCADLVNPDDRRRASDLYMTTASLFTLKRDLEDLLSEIEEQS